MTGSAERTTAETDVRVWVSLEPGRIQVDTGVGFFDHLLSSLAHHGRLSLEVSGRGDLETGGHHLVEDVGLVLGQALSRALGSRGSLERFGHAVVPMDDALVMAAVDLEGRPYLSLALDLPYRQWGPWETDLWPEFLRALAHSSRTTIHLRALAGSDPHHLMEASAKALGVAVGAAAARSERGSTKGSLGGDSE